MINAKELAQHYMNGARFIFTTTGEVMPIICFHGGPTEFIVQLMPNPKFHPSDQACAVAFAFSTVIEATHLVAVNETWMKKFDPPEAPEKMERGYLEELHKQGDMAVHTSLLVIAADLKNHEDSYVISRDVEEDTEEGGEEWTKANLGLGDGSYLDRLLHAWGEGKKNFMGGVEWPFVAATLAKLDTIMQVAVFDKNVDAAGIADMLAQMKAGEN